MVSERSGSIYDLGYARYDGARLGRSHAIWTLFLYSLRRVFGWGGSFAAKAFPIGLTVVSLVPALVQIAVAAIAPEDFEVVEAEDYFGFVAIIVALFCAVAAPEMIGRDERQHVLALYFSRALARSDYVTAKAAALAVSILLILALPQVLLVIGNAVASDDLIDHLSDNAAELAPIIVSSLLIAAFMAAVSIAIAGQTPRRAISTGAVLAYFVIMTAIGSALVNTTSGGLQRLSILISPFGLLDGGVQWIFGAEPDPGSAIGEADLAGGIYVLATLAYIALALGILYRRYLRMNV